MTVMWNEKLTLNDLLHVRAEVTKVDAKVYHLESALLRKALTMTRLLEDPVVIPGRQLVVFNVIVKHIDGALALVRGPDTCLAVLSELPDYSSYLEPCAGLGAMSIGANGLGIRSLGAIDLSPLAVETYRLNHMTHIMCGNVMDGKDLGAFFKMAGSPRCGLMVGFPCPPFSSMGDQAGFRDARAEVFIQCLNMAYLFDSTFIVLECTPKTGSWPEVHDLLASLCTSMGYCYKDGVLNFHRSWACRRSRWWAVLLPERAQPFLRALRDLPAVPELQVVSSIIPEWPIWPLPHIKALDWMEFEAANYLTYVKEGNIVLNVAGTCPTLLHSMGHHFMACPCGCRHGPLAASRLSRDGLTTVALHSDSASAGLRHLHPLEAAHLLTVPCDFRLPPGDLRKTLPLFGQLAAPLQVQWVCHQALTALNQAGFPTPILAEAEETHHAFLHRLLWFRHGLWLVPSLALPRTLKIQTDENCFYVKLDSPLTVRQLLDAHRDLLEWGERIALYVDGQMQPDSFYLVHKLYYMDKHLARHALPLTAQPCVVKINAGQESTEHSVPRGTHLFMALAHCGLDYLDFDLHTVATSSIASRVWTSTILDLDTPRGAGDVTLRGLATIEVQHEVDALIGDRTEVLILPIDWLADILSKPRVVAGFHLHKHLEKCISDWTSAPRSIVLVACYEGHWFAMIYDLLQHKMYGYDSIPGRSVSLKDWIALIFTRVFNAQTLLYPDRTLLLQEDDDLCGTHTLINLGWHFDLWQVFSYEQALQWHHALTLEELHRGSGANDHATAHTWLVNFLPSRGVGYSTHSQSH